MRNLTPLFTVLLLGTFSSPAMAQQINVDNSFLQENVITNDMQLDEITNLRNELAESLRRLDIIKRCHANNELVVIRESSNNSSVASCNSVGNATQVNQRFSQSCTARNRTNCNLPSISLAAYAGRNDLKLSATGRGNLFGSSTTGTINVDLRTNFSNRIIAEARDARGTNSRRILASYNAATKLLTISNQWFRGSASGLTPAVVGDVTIQTR